MDRARKAGFVGNNYVQNQVLKKLRSDHLARLKKIKCRKPGTSVTLDNNPPEVVNKTGENPRRKALKDLFGLITERENKAMLQRISTILTAEPKSAVKDYYRMKKLVVSKHNGDGNAYDRYMRKKRTQKFFENIKKQQPYYKKSDWERHYREHVKNMRFMREVNYKRPPDFVDPFAPPVQDEQEDMNARMRNARLTYAKPPLSTSPRRDTSKQRRISQSAAHVNRVRDVKHSKSIVSKSDGSRSRGRLSNDDCLGGQNGDGSEGSSIARSTGISTSEDKFPGDEIDTEEDEVIDLASIRRDIRISEEVSLKPTGVPQDVLVMVSSVEIPGESKLSVYSAEAAIDCFMINREYIVLTAFVDEQEIQFEAEAEITLEDLVILRGTDLPADSLIDARDMMGRRKVPNSETDQSATSTDDSPACDGAHMIRGSALEQELSAAQTLANDIPTLVAIATEMVQHVELRVDLDGGPRLILNLISEEEQLMGSSDTDGAESVSGPAEAPSSQMTLTSHLSEEELAEIFLEDPNKLLLVKGMRLPVSFSAKPSASIGNITAIIEAAKFSKKLEHIFALIKVYGTGDDQMAVRVWVMTSTATQFLRGLRPAVVKDSSLCLITSLPSVIHADPELMNTFANNLVQNVRIHHDGKTGKNTLTIDEQL